MPCFSTETWSGVKAVSRDLTMEMGGEGLCCQEMFVLFTVDLMLDLTFLGCGCLEWTSNKFSSQEKVVIIAINYSYINLFHIM